MNNINIMSGRRNKGNLPQHLEEKKGWYYYVVTINNKTKWYTLQTKDIKIALERWAILEGKLREKKFILPDINSKSILFSDFWIEYEKDIHRHKSERTKRDEQRLIKFLLQEFGNKRITEITEGEITRYRDKLRATPYEANHRLKLFRHIFSIAKEWDYLDYNPVAEVKLLEIANNFKLRLTTDILFEKIYPSADIKLKTAIMLGFHLSQHEKEVKGLRWSNINFEKREIKFIREKTGVEIVIHVNEALYQFLCYLKSKRSSIADYLIFHYDYENKKFVPYKSFKSLWKKALIKAGLKPGDYKFKELRHLANTAMKDAGISTDKRMAVTGHTSVAANQIYTHKTVGDSIDAAKSLERFRPAKF